MRASSLLRLFALLAAVSIFGDFPLHVQAQGVAQANRVTTAVAAGTRVPLSGHRAAWAAPGADLGAIPDAQTVKLIVGLSRAPQVQAAFDQLTADQQNPSSPRYHQWLTPAQVGQLYGPTEDDLAAVTTWLTGQGLSIDLVQPNRIFIEVSASAATVASALGTALHSYQVGNQTLQAPQNEPSVPAALAPVIAHIGGLTAVPRHIHSHNVGAVLNTATSIGRGAGAANSFAAHPDYSLGGGTNWIAPADFAVLYDLNTAYNAGISGTGERVMIIGGSRLNPPDLSNWESLSNLNAYAPNYIVGPGFTDPGQTNDDDMGEGTLDFERVYATAPAAQIDQVIAKNWLSSANFSLISYAINTVNDPVLSMSFGSCETQQTTAYVQQENLLYQQAAAQGISVFVSSGDGGVESCETQGQTASATQFASINDICASSYVTCVGGTEFNDANTATYWNGTNSTGKENARSYIPEGAWNEPTSVSASGVTSYVVLATGGGPSTIIPKPSFQTGIGVPADGARDTPDVAFSSSGHNAYFACAAYLGASCVPAANGSFYLTGFLGTSASAPSMAGIAALIDQKIGSKQGNMNPLLYRIFNSPAAATAVHDATIATSGVTGCTATIPSMCNNSDPSPTALTGGIAGYTLQTGYDLNTGIGSLDVSNFLAAAVSTLATSTTNLTASPVAPATNQTVTLTATVTSTSGTPTGTIVFTNTSSSPAATLGTVTLTNGTASLILPATTFSTAGTYALTASYSGDTSFAVSKGTLSLVVSAPVLPATTTVLAASATSITTQQTVTYTATVSSTVVGTPTGTVQFTKTTGGVTTNFGAAVALTSGRATLPPSPLAAGSYTIAAVYSGDANFSGSTSPGTALTVTAVATTTAISGIPANVSSVSPITPVAVVTPSGATGNPTGTVLFKATVGPTTLTLGPAVAVSGGVATGTPFYLPGNAGAYTISAVYSGDAIFATSTGTASSISTAVATTTVFSPVPAAVQPSATVTLTALVSPISAGVLPTGKVNFINGTAVLGTAAVSATGLASASVTLPAGPSVLTAVFAGDTTYLGSSSATVPVTVPTFSLSAATPSLTLASASSASGTDVINVTNAAGFTGNIGFACVATLTSNVASAVPPSCTVNPASIAYPSATQTTVTITTIAPHLQTVTLSGLTPKGSRGAAALAGGLVSLAGVLFLCLPMLRRRSHWRALAALLVLTGGLGALAGCGGKGAAPAPSGGTTPGTYNVTVTGTSSTGIPPVATTFSLTVN